MLRRALTPGRLALGLALWFAAATPLLSACSSGQTAQQRKTERYKRKHAPGTRIPCPTKDC